MVCEREREGLQTEGGPLSLSLASRDISSVPSSVLAMRPLPARRNQSIHFSPPPAASHRASLFSIQTGKQQSRRPCPYMPCIHQAGGDEQVGHCCVCELTNGAISAAQQWFSCPLSYPARYQFNTTLYRTPPRTKHATLVSHVSLLPSLTRRPLSPFKTRTHAVAAAHHKDPQNRTSQVPTPKL